MRGAVFVDGHHRLPVIAKADLGQAAAFFAPAVFHAGLGPLGEVFGHDHPDMGFTVDADCDLRFLESHVTFTFGAAGSARAAKIYVIILDYSPAVKCFSLAGGEWKAHWRARAI